MPADLLAFCVQTTLEDAYPTYTRFPLRTNPTTHLVTIRGIYGWTNYSMELQLTPTPTGVRVEGRQPRHRASLLSEAWTIMETCARQLAAAGSTPPPVLPGEAHPIVPIPR